MADKTREWNSEYFYGNKISPYGLENGFLDYGTLSKAFPCILNNTIYNGEGDWETITPDWYEDEETGEIVYTEIYQWYIIPYYAVEVLQEFTDDCIIYNNELDIYLWGISHFGTSWDYVLTDVRVTVEDES